MSIGRSTCHAKESAYIGIFISTEDLRPLAARPRDHWLGCPNPLATHSMLGACRTAVPGASPGRLIRGVEQTCGGFVQRQVPGPVQASMQPCRRSRSTAGVGSEPTPWQSLVVSRPAAHSGRWTKSLALTAPARPRVRLRQSRRTCISSMPCFHPGRCAPGAAYIPHLRNLAASLRGSVSPPVQRAEPSPLYHCQVPSTHPPIHQHGLFPLQYSRRGSPPATGTLPWARRELRPAAPTRQPQRRPAAGLAG